MNTPEMREDIVTLMERHGATVIAVVAVMLSIAQLLLGALELYGPLAHLYRGLFSASIVIVASVATLRVLNYPRHSLIAYFAMLGVLALLNWLQGFPWIAYPSLIAGMMLVVLLQQLARHRQAIFVFLGSFLVFSVQAAFAVSGMTTVALWILPLIAMAGALVLGARPARIYAGCCIAAITALGWADLSGLLAAHLPRSVSYYVVVLSTLIVVATYLGNSAMARYREAYEQSEQLSKQLAHEVQEATTARMKMQAVFEANPISTSIISPDGRYIDCNLAWEKNTGIRRDEAIGRNGIELGLWPKHDEYETAVNTLRTKGFLSDLPMMIKVADGSTRQGLSYVSPLGTDHNGKLVGIWLDQTDRLAADAAQRELNEALEQRVAQANRQLSEALQELAQSERLASLGSTVAGIAHELNTPLGNACLTATTLHDEAVLMRELIETRPLRKSELQDFVQSTIGGSELISRATTRASDLVAGYKQLVIEQTSETRHEFSLRRVIGDVIFAQSNAVSPHGAEIHSSLPDDVTCDSYPGPLAQVISALLKNAVTHAFIDRAPGRVDIDVSFTDRMICLNVRDDGIGMDLATQAKVFDPFFTSRLGQGGSGIGLAIAYRIASSILAGRLTVRATLGEGSCFTLEFPRIAPGRV